MKRNYDKKPVVKVDGCLVEGWDAILSCIQAQSLSQKTVVVDCYTGVHYDDLKNRFKKLNPDVFVDTKTLFKPEADIRKMTDRFMTDDVLFGYLTNLSIQDFFDEDKLYYVQTNVLNVSGFKLVFGHGASYVAKADVLIYADMPRWEIQMRMRRKEVMGLGVDNCEDPVSVQYKRGLFNDWRVCDLHKKAIYDKVDYWLDTVLPDPKMIDRSTFFAGMDKAAHSPFRVVPFFDPAPWGGQWMKEVCSLDPSKPNYGWCFDCVPEENSLLLEVGSKTFEMPSINLVHTRSRDLLGEPVEARFGKEFPIRFDFLDTIKGGNLSLQVHPTTQFMQENFGYFYTQDESYYIMDAGENASVYLGLKTGIDSAAMVSDLERAQKENTSFDAEKYVNKIPTKKHDHFLIPGGTVHCSGAEVVVLEISSTPSIFTFKLWDWGRLGLDGKPRPINIARGKKVIQWNRDTEYTHKYLANCVVPVAQGDGWSEEKTGLHRNEFIETRRHRFTKPVLHDTDQSVNVLNLVDGEQAIVESPEGRFEPFVVNYAETFIIPASVGKYSIRPYGASEGKECMTIKAYVRI